MRVSDNRRLSDAVADKARLLSDYRRVRDFFADKGGPAGADDGTHRHHNPAAASATCADSDSDSSPPEAAESGLSAASWQPLQPSVPKRRRPTTGHAAPPRHPRRGPTDARQKPQHPREARHRQNIRMPGRGLVGDSDTLLSPKPSTASRVARSESEVQQSFIKWWNQRDHLAHTTTLPPAPPPPPPQQSSQDASHTPSPAEASMDCQQDASHTPSPAEAGKDCQQGFLAQLAFTGAVFMGIRGGLNDLLFGWNKAVKVIFVLSLIVGAGMLAAGLMATSVISTAYTRTVLSTCARFCTCLAVFMLIVDLSVLMGSNGYIAGTILGLVAVLFTVSVWVKGDPAAYGVYMRAQDGTKHLCGCFKWSRERGPILPI